MKDSRKRRRRRAARRRKAKDNAAYRRRAAPTYSSSNLDLLLLRRVLSTSCSSSPSPSSAAQLRVRRADRGPAVANLFHHHRQVRDRDPLPAALPQARDQLLPERGAAKAFINREEGTTEQETGGRDAGCQRGRGEAGRRGKLQITQKGVAVSDPGKLKGPIRLRLVSDGKRMGGERVEREVAKRRGDSSPIVSLALAAKLLLAFSRPNYVSKLSHLCSQRERVRESGGICKARKQRNEARGRGSYVFLSSFLSFSIRLTLLHFAVSRLCFLARVHSF